MQKVSVLVLKYNWLTRTVILKDEFPHGFSHITVSFHNVKLCSTRIVKQVFLKIEILTFAAKCCNGSPSSLYVKLPNNMPSVSLSLNSP